MGEHQAMIWFVVACLFLSQGEAQVRTRGKKIIIPLPKDASGSDVYPDCNKGKVCLPEARHCATRKSLQGSLQFQNKTYWFNWQSNEPVLREGKWNWFTARNYCRKRCMDLVSFENEQEWNLVKNFMQGARVSQIWTAARLCAVSTSGRHVAARAHNQMALHQPADSAKSPVWRLSTGSGMTRRATTEDRLCVRIFLQIIFNLFATRILTYSYLEHRV